MIPRRLIYTHSSPYLMSLEQSDCYERAKRLHPGWEVELFSDNDCFDFVEAEFPELREFYEWYPRGIQRADIFRILSVLKKGGFYMDLDVYLHENLDELCIQRAVFPLEWEMDSETFFNRHKKMPRNSQELWQVGNYAFGAEAGHPFLHAVVEEMIQRSQYLEPFFASDADVLFTTGPDLVTAVFYRNLDSFSEIVTLLRGRSDPLPPVFDGVEDPCWYQFGKFGNHLLEGTWKSKAGKGIVAESSTF